MPGTFDISFLPFFIIFILLIIAIPVIFIYLFLRLSEAAFEQIGFDHWHASLAVFGSVIGSLIDIPLHSSSVSSYPGWFVSVAGMLGQTFPTDFHPIYLDVNLGGCLIPLVLSVDLLFRREVSAYRAFAGTMIVAFVTYIFATPVANSGIVLPFWLSPILAAICGLVLAKGYSKAPAICYISGSMGTLLGADIFNLLTPGVLPELSPLSSNAVKPLVLSIGGAGVFDGIFLTGILAVLFAAGIVCVFHGSCEGVVMHRTKKS